MQSTAASWALQTSQEMRSLGAVQNDLVALIVVGIKFQGFEPSGWIKAKMEVKNPIAASAFPGFHIAGMRGEVLRVGRENVSAINDPVAVRIDLNLFRPPPRVLNGQHSERRVVDDDGAKQEECQCTE